jgi:ParB family chromosome partitioning protein
MIAYETAQRSDGLEAWPIGRLKANPANPRGPVDPASVQELAASIRSQGILQPLLVTPAGLVVAGHRRFAAARVAGLAQVPVLVRDLSEPEQMEIMLVENLQREDLTPLQEARAYRALLDQGRLQSDIVRQVGVSGPRIQGRLAILRLEPSVQELFDRGELPLHCALILARIAESHQQSRLALLVARRRLTVDRLKEIVNGGEGVRVLPKRPPQGAAVRRGDDEEEERDDGSSQPGRAAALELLEASPTRTFTFADIREAFDPICGVCGDCGMASLQHICGECPLPRLVGRLAAQ